MFLLFTHQIKRDQVYYLNFVTILLLDRKRKNRTSNVHLLGTNYSAGGMNLLGRNMSELT